MDPDVVQPLSLYERRRAFTAREIQNVAFELFAQRGFETVTVDEIAERAGMSARTFFRYFSSKEELLSRYVDSRSERLLAELQRRPDDEGGVTALREAFIVTSHIEAGERAALIRRYQVLIREGAIRARSHSPWTAPEGPLAREVHRRLGGSRNTELTAVVIVTAMYAVASAAFDRWADSGGKGDPSDQVQRALAMLEQGLTDDGMGR